MWELEQQVEELVNKYLKESEAVRVNAPTVGLDNRCGYVYVILEEDTIAVKGSTYSIDYFGGFEYMDPCYRTTIGDITFYSGDHSRVRDAIDYYKENTVNNDQEELEGEQT